MKLTQKQKGVIALVLLALLFASMGVFARYMQTSFTLFQQVYLRVAAALLLSLIFFKNKINLGKILKINSRDWLVLVFRSLMLYVFGVSLFTYGIINAKYSNVSFISALPLTAVFGFILLKEEFTFKKMMYILLAFIGVVFISVTDLNNLFNWGRGEFVTLISVVFFSLSYVGRKWHSKLLNNYEITTLIFLISLIFVFLTSFFMGESLPIYGWSYFLGLVVLFAGLFNVGNLYLTNYGFERVEAVFASNLLTLESLFAIFIGFIFFREVPVMRELVGGALIIFSVIKMNELE